MWQQYLWSPPSHSLSAVVRSVYCNGKMSTAVVRLILQPSFNSVQQPVTQQTNEWELRQTSFPIRILVDPSGHAIHLPCSESWDFVLNLMKLAKSSRKCSKFWDFPTKNVPNLVFLFFNLPKLTIFVGLFVEFYYFFTQKPLNFPLFPKTVPNFTIFLDPEFPKHPEWEICPWPASSRWW